MEFLKRKHFSLWIITTTTFICITCILDSCAGLQGVPTWMCLGLKSPFIEFSNEHEVLANTSIPLNITKDEQALMHQEGLRKLGTFIKPVDLRDSETGFVKANLTKKITPSSGAQNPRRLHPIQEEMDQKQIILLDLDTDENGLPASLTDEDRKFIVPMALKNASPDPRTAMLSMPRALSMSGTTTTTTAAPKTTMKRAPTQATAEFASNIDDLKKHILFLQNMTKHDSNFQAKFVVFPSLQKDKYGKPIGPPPQSTPPSTTQRPQRPIFQYSPPLPPPTRKVPFGGYYHNSDEEDQASVFMAPPPPVSSGHEKITIVPQVLLLNDQTNNGQKKQRNRNGNKGEASTTTSTSTTTTTTTTPEPTTTVDPRRATKRPPCIRNPESPKCVRQRKREELQRQRDREQLLREQELYLKPHYEPYMQTLNNTKRFAVSIEIPDSFKVPLNDTGEGNTMQSASIAEEPVPIELQRLSRSPRSHHKRRNSNGGGGGKGQRRRAAALASKFDGSVGAADPSGGVTYNLDEAEGRDFIMGGGGEAKRLLASTPSPTVAAYSEPIDLNPDNCYLVDGMSYGQKKQCVLHTSVMPAISRGARAAIQECQHQFKNRRWNCNPTEDNTVFGPMTALGTPEMAFIHALAAATVTSFIARACRDGQLASCGCSRGSRPKQLHDDWTWGGCGDNLEYAYKFATDFIDIREKETKRGTRGAGNPERKRGGRGHQRRQHLLAAMQADEAAAGRAGATATTAKTTTPTTTTTMKSLLQDDGGAARLQNEHVNTAGDNNNNQQANGDPRNSNKTVSGDPATGVGAAGAATSSSININPNDNNNDGKSVGLLVGSIESVAVTSSKDSPLPSAARSSSSSVAPPRQESSEEDDGGRIKPEDLLELQERITKEILNSKLQEKEMLELQEKINREILNSKVFNMDSGSGKRKRKRKNQRAVNGNAGGGMTAMEPNGAAAVVAAAGGSNGKWRSGGGGGGNGGASLKARSLMNLHNNEAGRRAVIKKTRITCKCHGVSGSCSLITCWQQLSSIREIGDYLREKYEESTEVKMNKRGRLQVKDPQFKVPTAHDLVYLEESPDWCRSNRQLQWPGTHGRVCNKTSSGLDGCGILCCGRGYNTKNIVVRERCNCRFHWCCQVKCDVCVKVLEEHTCK